MPRHVHVITLADEPFRDNFLIAVLSRYWTDAGHRLTVGPAFPDDADIGLLHVDRTVVPTDSVPPDDGRPVLNRRVLDISKRCMSQQVIDQHDAWGGPVIIKTNRNAGGSIERLRERPARWSRPWLREKLARRWGWSWRASGHIDRYPVVASTADVPAWVWRRDDLVVERFEPERDGDHYVVRVYLFLGDREYGVKLIGNHPVVKARSIVDYQYLDTFSDALRATRERHGMDFGKIDYVEVDGEPRIIDVNKTPTISSDVTATSRCHRLVPGLWHYLAEDT